MFIMRRHVVCLVAWPLNESPVICVLFVFGSEIKKYKKCHFFNYYIKHTRQSHPTPEPSPVNCSNNMESDVDEILFKFPSIKRVLLLNHLLHN